MAFEKSTNPTLGPRVFENARGLAIQDKMTVSGAANKTLFLLILLCITAAWAWNDSMLTVSDWGGEGTFRPSPFLMPSLIGGFVIALITVFKPVWSNVTAPLYALVEGIVIGSISASMESMFPGIVFQAATATFGTLAALLLIYRSGLVQVNEKFRMVVFAATGGIALVYLLSFILGFFGIQMPMIHEGGMLGIGFSVFVVIVAALNLMLDFEFIASGARAGAPKYMEWYSGFALLVTLVWLYIEFIRLLSKLRSRN